MKLFITACVIFALLAASVTVNTIYIARITDEMLSCARRLPTCDEDKPASLNGDEAYAGLCRVWEKNRYYVCVTVSHDESDAVDEVIIELASAFQNGDAAAYDRARLMAVEILTRIKHAESVSWEGIL